MNFREGIEEFMLEFKTKSREVMTMFKDFMNGHYDMFIMLWFLRFLGEFVKRLS
jgi:hypothetical protein